MKILSKTVELLSLFRLHAPMGGNLEPAGLSDLEPREVQRGAGRDLAVAGVLLLAGGLVMGELFARGSAVEKAPPSVGSVEHVVVPEVTQVRYVVPDNTVTVANASVPVSVARSAVVVPDVTVAGVVRDVVAHAQVSRVTVAGEVNVEVV